MNPQTLTFICQLVKERSAISLDATKEYLVSSRLLPIIKSEKLANLDELVSSIQNNSRNDLQDQIVDALTTNETLFFRDGKPFEVLKNIILPDLIEKKNGADISIWSAACSSGQEPYSIAMMIHDHFKESYSGKFVIKATDISPTILERAQEAEYSQHEMNRGLPTSYLVKHFTQDGLHWRLKDSIKSMVDFDLFNLDNDSYRVDQHDVIFLRNVLIYFDMETRVKIINHMVDVVKPGGYLILGSVETLIGHDLECLNKVNVDGVTVYKKV